MATHTHSDGALTMATLSLAAIESVYYGKAGCCCCGCSGTYRYASAFSAGHENIVSDVQVKRVVALLRKAPNVEIGDGYFSADIGSRRYIAYLAAASK